MELRLPNGPPSPYSIPPPRIKSRNRPEERCLPQSYLLDLRSRFNRMVGISDPLASSSEGEAVFDSTNTPPEELAREIAAYIRRSVEEPPSKWSGWLRQEEEEEEEEECEEMERPLLDLQDREGEGKENQGGEKPTMSLFKRNLNHLTSTAGLRTMMEASLIGVPPLPLHERQNVSAPSRLSTESGAGE